MKNKLINISISVLKHLTKWFTILLIALIGLLFVVVILLHIPGIQNALTDRTEKILSEKFNSKVEIGGINLDLLGNLKLTRLVIDDPQGEEILNLEKIEIDLSIPPLLIRKIKLDRVLIQGLTTSLKIDPDSSTTNIDFIINSFSETSTDDADISKPWDILFSDIAIEESGISLTIARQLDLLLDIGSLKLLSDASSVNEADFQLKDVNLSDITVDLELMNDSQDISSFSGSTDNAGEKVAKPASENLTSDVQRIVVSNLKVNLNMMDEFQLLTSIPDFEGRNIHFNLLDQVIRASALRLKEADAEIDLMLPDTVQVEQTAPPGPPDELFINNFNWNIALDDIQIIDCAFGFEKHFIQDTVTTYPISRFGLDDIDIEMNGLLMADRQFDVRIENVSFQQADGPDLKHLGGVLNYADDSLQVKSFELLTARSDVRAEIMVYGKYLMDLKENADQMGFRIMLNECRISTTDLEYIMSREVVKYGVEYLEISTEASGSLADFVIDHFELRLDEQFSGSLKGEVRNLLAPEVICLENIQSDLMVKKDLILQVFDTVDMEQYELPEEIKISTEINGCYDNMHVESSLVSSLGRLFLKARYAAPKQYGQTTSDTLSWVLNADALELGTLLGVDSLGRLSFQNETQAGGLLEGPLSIETNLVVDTILYNQQLLAGFQASADYRDQRFHVSLDSRDTTLLFNLKADGQVIDSLMDIKITAVLENLNLGQLGLVDQPFRLSGNIESRDQIGKGFLDGSLKLSGFNIETERNILIDTIETSFLLTNDSTAFVLNSGFLQGELMSNIPLDQLDERIIDFHKAQFIENDSVIAPGSGRIHFTFHARDPLDDLLPMVPGLNEFHFSKIQGKLDEIGQQSVFSISIFRINYNDLIADSIEFMMNSNREALRYKLSIPHMQYQQYTMPNLELSGRTEMSAVNNIFTLGNAPDSILLRTGFVIQQTEDRQFILNIDEDSLIINRKIWDVEGDNIIALGGERKMAGNIHITNGPQSLQLHLSDTLYQANVNDLDLSRLSGLLQSINPSFVMAGHLDMELKADMGGAYPQIQTSVLLENFSFQETALGNISLSASNESNQSISGQANLENGNNNLLIEGTYNLSDKSSPISANAELSFNELSAFGSFGNELIADPSGKLKGRISISGNSNSLDAKGDLNFNTVEFLFSPVNNRYRITDESISLNNRRLVFDDFTLLDSAGNQFQLDGFLEVGSLSGINADLDLSADQFTVYNVLKKENPNLYGKLIITLNAGIRGNLDHPEILANLMINKGTNMTYAMPPKNFDLISSEGIVEFVDFSETDTTLEIGFQQQVGDTIFSKLNWIDLNATLNVDKEAQFMIDIDPVSGDYVQFGGTGNLNLVVEQNKKPRINGTYVFDRGIYEVSFYGLVKKEFEFRQGSSITWTGDPYKASLNLKASYNIRTAALALVSRETYGLPDEEKSQYRRALPFSVTINIDGQLDKPDIGFNIDLPQEEKNAFPLVEAKLNQLNDGSHDSELTRQVFGLLTIGSFIPETTGPGSTSDYGSALASTAAANSLNAILSNELNKLSGKYIRFVDLDIGMQTFSDLDGGGQNTRTTMDVRLSKKLFNERVTIEAQGSFDLQNEANKYMLAPDQSNVYTDFAIIYDLREKKGDYKLKAFQRSAYDIIYKDTQIGGIAVIFLKEFDKYQKTRKPENNSGGH